MEERRLWGHLTSTPQYLWGDLQEDGIRLFLVTGGQDSRHNLKYREIQTRRKMFKIQLDKALL